MKFSSIFIANLAEIAKPLTDLMHKKRGDDEIFEDHAICDRFIFANQDNRVLITPFPIENSFFDYAKKLLRFKNVVNLYPKKLSYSLSKSILSDKNLLNKLIAIIGINPGIEIVSYAATPEFIELVNYLRNKALKFDTPEIPQENESWTSYFFDSKAGFRQINPQLGQDFPSMPEGVICSSQNEIKGWAQYFIKKSGGCVLKTNRGLAGAGLQIIKESDLKKSNLIAFIDKLLASEPYWTKEITIVEEFIEPDMNICGGAPNIELTIKNGKLKPLYVCGMRMTKEGVFKGVEIGKGAVPAKLTKDLIKHGVKFGKYLKKFAYQGYFEIDWVIAKKNKIYPIEANLRRTGGTHVFELAQQLLENDFLHKYYIVANNIVDAPNFSNNNFLEVQKKTSDFLYPMNNKKEGIIITVMNYLKKGKFGYVAIGKNSARVHDIENKFLELIN